MQCRSSCAKRAAERTSTTSTCWYCANGSAPSERRPRRRRAAAVGRRCCSVGRAPARRRWPGDCRPSRRSSSRPRTPLASSRSARSASSNRTRPASQRRQRSNGSPSRSVVGRRRRLRRAPRPEPASCCQNAPRPDLRRFFHVECLCFQCCQITVFILLSCYLYCSRWMRWYQVVIHLYYYDVHAEVGVRGRAVVRSEVGSWRRSARVEDDVNPFWDCVYSWWTSDRRWNKYMKLYGWAYSPWHSKRTNMKLNWT